MAESLVALLLDGKRNIFRLAAVELMGRGYPIWLPFIHGASIFKLLYSWLIQLYAGDEQFYQTTLKAVIHILTATETTGLNLDSVSTLSVGSNGTVSRKSSSSTLSLSHHQQASVPLITWLNELNTSLQGSRDVSQIERKCSIELLKNLLSFKPIVFRGHEQILVEIVMKLAEPGNLIYEELNSHFGVISIHATSQRLAVSSPDNALIVYDMKTGNRITLLQGHVHPCTLVAFNPERLDGKQLISYSADEACVRWWLASTSSTSSSSNSTSSNTSAISGLFSSLTGASIDHASSSTRPGSKPVKVTIAQPELTEAIDCIPSGSVFKLNPINLNWNVKGNKVVEFRVGANLIQTFPIP